MRSLPLLAIATVAIALLAVGLFVGHRLSSSPTNPTPTARPTSTSTVLPPPVKHGSKPVHLAAEYKSFVDRICGGLAANQAKVLENHLEYYQFNEGAYWGWFNQGEGQFTPANTIGQWLGRGSHNAARTGANARCVRVGPSFMGHGVVLTRGWRNPKGGWCLLDLDKRPKSGAWTIDDFTFGSNRRVVDAFLNNEPRSVAYHAVA